MTSTTLKILAAILMVIDHTGQFIPGMPLYLRWIGRLSAPIFFYCSTLAIHYTKNRTNYLRKLYIFSIIMAIIDLTLIEFFNHLYITNNIFRVIFTYTIVIYIIDEILKNRRRGLRLGICYVLWQTVSSTIFLYVLETLPNIYRDFFEILIPPVMGSLLYLEGGIVFVLLGIGMYYFCFNKKRLSVFYIVFCLSYFAMTASGVVTRVLLRIEWWGFQRTYNILKYIVDDIVRFEFSMPHITREYIFVYNYQWIMLASLPLLLLYNGKKGKGYSNFFYIFYPAHIIVLFLISYLLSL